MGGSGPSSSTSSSVANKERGGIRWEPAEVQVHVFSASAPSNYHFSQFCSGDQSSPTPCTLFLVSFPWMSDCLKPLIHPIFSGKENFAWQILLDFVCVLCALNTTPTSVGLNYSVLCSKVSHFAFPCDLRLLLSHPFLLQTQKSGRSFASTERRWVQGDPCFFPCGVSMLHVVFLPFQCVRVAAP